MSSAKKPFYDYEGREIVVRYEPRRCIHAEECIKGAPGVFERDRRPWIVPDEGEAEHIAGVVMRCPTGALHFERRDGGEPEPTLEPNRGRLASDGPLYLEGRLRLVFADGSEREENRVALCRCGASRNKPFCDNSHLDAGFTDDGSLGAAMMGPADAVRSGELQLSMVANGPVVFEGELEIEDAAGEERQEGGKGALCRCGASGNRPYCDGSHVAADFEAD